MEKLTSKDIRILREYIDRLEAIVKESKEEHLTPDEWNEIMECVHRTGKVPEKYAGRIGEEDIMVYSDVVDGEFKHFPEGKTKKAYYSIGERKYEEEVKHLEEEYHDFIIKALHSSDLHDKVVPGALVYDIIHSAISIPDVLDIANLPNLLPTDKNLQYALTPFRNENAYIMPFDPEQLAFEYDENGELVISTQAQYNAVEEAKDGNTEIEIDGIDQPLLRQLLAATLKAYLSNYGNSITVYLPSFAREMNIDISIPANQGEKTKHNANDFFKKLKALENLNGVWQQGSFYRVFILDSYDRTQNTLTFSSPWLFKIVKELLSTPANKKTRADGSVMWEITGISHLMKPSIVSARSKPTVEIIATLIAGLQQYGVKPESARHPGRKYKDKELVEYEISIKTLINRIPVITESLKHCSPSNKTTLLQRYFCGSNYKKRQEEGKGYILSEYIEKYTWLKDYYKDFKIKFQPPTINTLSDKIVITHRGINGDYTSNNALNEVLFKEKTEEKEA